MIQNFELSWTNIFFFYTVPNLQKREKDVNYLLEINLRTPKTRGYCYDTRVTLTAPAKRIGALGTRMKIYQFFFNFSLMRSAFRHCVCEESCAWNFVLRQWLLICTQIISSLRAVFKFQEDPFRLVYSVLRTGSTLWNYVNNTREVRKTIVTNIYIRMYFYYVIYKHRPCRNFLDISLFLSNRFTNTCEIN